MSRAETQSIDLSSLEWLRPGLFACNGDGVPLGLLGCRCEQCGLSFFPARRWCSRCVHQGRLVAWRLPEHAVVHASTVSRVRSALGHEPPYAYGYVTLGQGELRVFATFAHDAPESFKPGRAVRLELAAIKTAATSAKLGYWFVPAERCA